MKVLDLFSGIGGFSLGLERAGMETVAFCEIEPFCREVLAKHWPGVPIHEDITRLDGEQYRGTVDIVCGGFPCQPFSEAGKRRGKEDDRDLWPEMFRVIREVQPAWVIGENVAGFVNMELDRTLSDLEGAGYACQTFDIPALGVDAPHIRHRVWIVANASSGRCCGSIEGEIQQQGGAEAVRTSESLANNDRKRESQPEGNVEEQRGRVINGGQNVVYHQSITCDDAREDGKARQSCAPRRRGCQRSATEWLPEPAVGRMVNGLPNRLDRLRSLGNAVVPQIPEILGRAIMECEREAANG